MSASKHRFDPSSAQPDQSDEARRSTRILIRVPSLAPTAPAAAPRPLPRAIDSPAALSLTPPSIQLRIDRAHSDTPAPHAPLPHWLKGRSNLIATLLQRRTLLALGLIAAAAAGTLIFAGRSQSNRTLPETHRATPAAGQNDQRNRASAAIAKPTILRAQEVLDSPMSPAANWNVPAAANLPASLNDSAKWTDKPSAELARRDPPPSATTTDRRYPTSQPVAAFEGKIDKPPTPSSR